MTSLIIIFLFGVMMGYIIAKITSCEKPVGVLRVDHSDPDDGPYLFLELSSNPNTLIHDTYVTLKVNTQSYISQK